MARQSPLPGLSCAPIGSCPGQNVSAAVREMMATGAAVSLSLAVKGRPLSKRVPAAAKYSKPTCDA